MGFEQFGGEIDQNWVIMKTDPHLIGLSRGMFENNILTFNSGWDQEAKPLKSFIDVGELQRNLKEKGIGFESEADESDPDSFVVVDPDGNPILVDQHR